jgi:threonine aldolase
VRTFRAVRSFGSDNHSGVPPAVLDAIAAANVDHAIAYGEDEWTARAEQCFRDQLGEQARAFLVFNGSAANVLALRACCEPWQGVICTANAHIHVHEAGAPERIAGVKLHPVPSPDGKLRAEQIDPLLAGVGDEHSVQMKLVSVTQASELGTVYSVAELRAICEHAHELGLLVHLDGARLGNAAAALGVPLRALTTDVGVDIVSFGGTKLGLLGAEAVVLLAPELAPDFRYLRMQTGQLASKSRFLAAQFIALLEDDLWLELAGHANAMAARLAAAVGVVVEITQPVQSNAVFARLPRAAIAPLQEQWPFYVWDEPTAEVRWLCSWDTSAEEVDAFAAAIAAAV